MFQYVLTYWKPEEGSVPVSVLVNAPGKYVIEEFIDKILIRLGLSIHERHEIIGEGTYDIYEFIDMNEISVDEDDIKQWHEEDKDD